MIRKKVFVAMSGGVDSSVAALLLKRRGFEVVGVFMKNWVEGCDWKEDKRDAVRVCAKLGIPFFTFNFTREYKKEVIDYMLKEYKDGRTPNPDVMCNKKIKFGFFLKKSLEMGADYVATGHYVRISHLRNSDKFPISNFQFPNKSQIQNYKLLQAKDKNKDQSYFLWILTQKQLKYCLFPIGDYLKSEVREIARKAGLPNAQKKDSQGLCFVGKVKFKDFLSDLMKKSKIVCGNSGLIKTTNGEILGKHRGLEFYTIGQRHGIGIASKEPYFVAGKNSKENILIVGKRNDKQLYKKEIFAKDVNWITPEKIKFPFSCFARIRYRQPLGECAIRKTGGKGVKLIFKKNVWAAASGQSVVFYKGREMRGGGVIC